MGRKGRGSGNFYHAKRSAAAVPASTTSTNDCRAPTVGLEDILFTIGKTKDAARFEVVKEELGKHFATQFWSDAADAARAFEILEEPIYNEPTEPELPLHLLKQESVTGTDGVVVEPSPVEYPEYESKSQRYRMLISLYSCDHDEWRCSVKHWKDNKSRMFAILLQHCPKDLMQRLKSNDKYWKVNDKKDVISFVTMIRDVAHAHNDTTQGTMAIVLSDMALYTIVMSSTDDTDGFYRTFFGHGRNH